MDSWQLQDAKARMSDLVRKAQARPQRITLRGRPVAVVMSQEAFDALSNARGSLVDFMRASPLAGSSLPRFPRDRSPARRTPRF